MAQHRAAATGQQCRDLLRERRLGGVAERVYAAMTHAEPAELDPPRDRSGSEAIGDQLRVGDVSSLNVGERGDLARDDGRWVPGLSGFGGGRGLRRGRRWRCGRGLRRGLGFRRGQGCVNVTRVAPQVQLVTFAPLSVVNVTRVMARICDVTLAPLSVVNVTRGVL